MRRSATPAHEISQRTHNLRRLLSLNTIQSKHIIIQPNTTMSLAGFIHVVGWEDGEKVEKDLDALDRWTTQNADTLRITITDDLKINVKQNPHSKHLGGYVSI